MKNFPLILLALILMALLAISTSDKATRATRDRRTLSHGPFGNSRNMYGDLYRLSYLPEFRKKSDFDFNKTDIPATKCSGGGGINLTVAGDSFLSPAFTHDGTVFCCLDAYHYLKVNADETMPVNIVNGKKNILLIELAERELIFFADSTYLTRKLYKNAGEEKKYKMTVGRFSLLFNQTLYNPEIHPNLEFNLFGFNFFTPFKEAKAMLNDRIFNRLPGVGRSPDKKYLFYLATVDTTSELCAFRPVKNGTVTEIVHSLNYARRFYKALGYDEVYLAIIPNPVSILYPGMGTYNNLLSRIQSNGDLTVPYINIMPAFRSSPQQLYFNSDSHWNKNGFNLWLNEFNNRLKNDCVTTN